MKYAISYLINRSITAYRHHIGVTITGSCSGQLYGMAYTLGIFIIE